MEPTIFKLLPAAGGWRLIADGQPVFWFPEKASAMETARIMAEARALFRGAPASILAASDDGEMELVARYT